MRAVLQTEKQKALYGQCSCNKVEPAVISFMCFLKEQSTLTAVQCAIL